MNFLLRLSPLVVAASLAACGIAPVGPNYRLPPRSVAANPAAARPFENADGPNQAHFSSQPLPAHWWRLYHDDRLDHLVEEALAHNTDLRQATANLERVRSIEAETEGERKPKVTTSLNPYYGHVSGLQLLEFDDKPANSFLYEGKVGLSYQLDLFGQLRRADEAARAGTEGAEAGVDLVKVNVAAGTARAYAEVCSAGLELEAAKHSIDLQTQAVDVSTKLQRAGRTGAIDLNRARGQLQQLNATLPPLQAARQGALYRLATLTGRVPQDFPREVADCATPPRVEGTVPVGDGAALIRRRPDIRQAERMLAQSTARIGVATADLYPKISFGVSRSAFGELDQAGNKANFAWGLGPLIQWSIPIDGVVRARIAQSEAGTRGALARFDGTVLNALRETETALDAYARELDRHQALEGARDENRAVAEQARQLYRNGKTGYLESLDAERALAGAEAALAVSQARLAEDQVRVFMALGGGWEPDPASRSSGTPVAAR